MTVKTYRIVPGNSFRLPDGTVQDRGLIELDQELAQLHAGKVEEVTGDDATDLHADGDRHA